VNFTEEIWEIREKIAVIDKKIADLTVQRNLFLSLLDRLLKYAEEKKDNKLLREKV
jgi:hypothetical protein